MFELIMKLIIQIKIKNVFYDFNLTFKEHAHNLHIMY